jgi:hypothetical protein
MFTSRAIFVSSRGEDFGGGMLNFDENLGRSEDISALTGPGWVVVVSFWLDDFGSGITNFGAIYDDQSP